MKEQKPLSVVLTSGTLTPFKSFGSELQLEFPIELINKHVIDTKSRVNLSAPYEAHYSSVIQLC